MHSLFKSLGTFAKNGVAGVWGVPSLSAAAGGTAPGGGTPAASSMLWSLIQPFEAFETIPPSVRIETQSKLYLNSLW